MEFDIERNHMLTSEVSTRSTNDLIWWQCQYGHSFQRSPSHRINRTRKCPVCERNIVVKGINDMATTYPQIIGIWDFDANERTLESISDICNDKFAFKCNKGHHYSAYMETVKYNNFECLVCNGKIIVPGVNSLLDIDYELSLEFSPNETRKPTEFTKNPAYSVLWRCKKCNGDYYYPIKNRLLDDSSCPYCEGRLTMFGINSLQDTHPDLAKEYSDKNERDVKTIRKASKIWTYWDCPECRGTYGAFANLREVNDNSCPYCKGERALEGFNSLADTHRELISEWSPNNEYGPERYLKSNTYTVGWICLTCNGEYLARICDREYGDDSCPYCTNRKVLPRYNSFAVRHKDLLASWDYLNNYILADPDTISDSCTERVWWICETNPSHKYQLSPK